MRSGNRTKENSEKSSAHAIGVLPTELALNRGCQAERRTEADRPKALPKGHLASSRLRKEMHRSASSNFRPKIAALNRKYE